MEPCQPSSRQHQVLDNVLQCTRADAAKKHDDWRFILGALALVFPNFELFNLDEMSFLNPFDRISTIGVVH